MHHTPLSALLSNEQADSRRGEPKAAGVRSSKLEVLTQLRITSLTASMQVYKEMILVTRQDAPLPRVGKGTVSRPAALALYDADIRAL
jgi:hypothetical protein